MSYESKQDVEYIFTSTTNYIFKLRPECEKTYQVCMDRGKLKMKKKRKSTLDVAKRLLVGSLTQPSQNYKLKLDGNACWETILSTEENT